MNQQPAAPNRFALAVAAATASLTLAGGVTAASLAGWIGPIPSRTQEPSPLTAVPAEATSPSQVVLVPVRADERQASLRGPSEGAPSSVAAAVDPSPALAPGPAAPAPEPVYHVDEVGNTWAWYGQGDWVLVTPAPAAPSIVLASQAEAPRVGETRERDRERERHDDDDDRERAARSTQVRSGEQRTNSLQTFTLNRREHDDDD